MVTICGSGFPPPAGIVKFKAATDWNVCARSDPQSQTIDAQMIVAKTMGLNFKMRLFIGLLSFLRILWLLMARNGANFGCRAPSLTESVHYALRKSPVRTVI